MVLYLRLTDFRTIIILDDLSRPLQMLSNNWFGGLDWTVESVADCFEIEPFKLLFFVKELCHQSNLVSSQCSYGQDQVH